MSLVHNPALHSRTQIDAYTEEKLCIIHGVEQHVRQQRAISSSSGLLLEENGNLMTWACAMMLLIQMPVYFLNWNIWFVFSWWWTSMKMQLEKFRGFRTGRSEKTQTAGGSSVMALWLQASSWIFSSVFLRWDWSSLEANWSSNGRLQVNKGLFS